jgi:hypothetical protein
MRLLVPVLCAAAALWLVPVPRLAAPTAAPVEAPAQAQVQVPASAVEPLGCKPLAPIDVLLETPGGAGPGFVPVRLVVAPRMELSSLAWHWELSPDVRLADGARDGVAAPGRGVATAEDLVLLVPDDGRRHRADLVVTGRLPSALATEAAALTDDGEPVSDAQVSDAPAQIVAVRSLTWGPLPDPGPVVLSADAETGALVPVLAVPSIHTPAGAAGGR